MSKKSKSTTAPAPVASVPVPNAEQQPVTAADTTGQVATGTEAPTGLPPAPPAPPAPPVAPAAPAAPVKDKQPTQNDVTRPSDGTTTRKVWEIADQISSAKPGGAVATRKEVVDAAAAQGINSSTATTQFGKWCKFNGYVAEKSPSKSNATTQPPAAAPAVSSPGTDEAKQKGRDAFAAHSRGEAVTNPYVASTPEADAFSAGWTEAASAPATA